MSKQLFRSLFGWDGHLGKKLKPSLCLLTVVVYVSHSLLLRKLHLIHYLMIELIEILKVRSL